MPNGAPTIIAGGRNPGGFVGMMPGQRASMTEGGKGELPIFRSWLHNLYWYDMLTVASVLWEIWTLGPHLVAAIFFVWLFWQFKRWPWFCIILTILPIWFYGLAIDVVWAAWPTILWGRSPDQIYPLPLWILALIPAPVWWVAWYRGRWRNNSEITDPYAPGTIGVRPPGGGAVGPDNPYGDNGLMTDATEEPEIQVVVERECRVVVPGMRHKGPLPEDAAQFVRTPDGKTRYTVAEVEHFARQLPALGANYSGVWDDQFRHNVWRDLIDICAGAGIVAEPVQGRPTEVLVRSSNEAVSLIRGLVAQFGASQTPLPHPENGLAGEK